MVAGALTPSIAVRGIELDLHQQPRCSGDFEHAHVLTEHFTMKADTFTKVGAVLAGQEVDLTLF